MHELEKGFSAWVIAHRWWIIILTLVAVGLAAAGARHLSFTNNYRVFFSADNPQLRAFDALEDTYTKIDNVLIVLAPRDGDVFDRDTLATVEWLTEAAWQTPYSTRVDSITNFQHTEAEGDELVVADLVSDASGLDDAALAKVRRVALAEPMLVNRLVSPEGHVTGVNITIQLPGENAATEMPEVVAFARDLVERTRARAPATDVYLTGMVMMNNAFAENSLQDMSTLVPVSFAVMLAALAVLLRSLAGTLVTAVVILFSIATAMGLGGWTGFAISPPTTSAPTIILTLAIASSVHILVSFFYEMRHHGADRKAAMAESLRVNVHPVFLTSLTTAIGFLSMNFSDAPPFRHLGNLVATGVAASFFYSVLFLPALMTLLPVRPRPAGDGRPTFMARFAELVVARRRLLLWGAGAVILLLVAQVPRNELNDVFTEYFDTSVPFRQHADFVNENLGGLYRIDYSLESGEPGGISDPGFLRTVDAFARWWERQPEVIHVQSITDTFRRLNRNMHGDDPAWHRLPGARNLAAQYLLLYEMSLPYGLDLNNQIDVDKSATRLSVTIKTLSSNEVLALEARASRWLADNAPVLSDAQGTGPTIMFAHIGKRNIKSMLTGTTIALVLISMILVLALRSVKIGLTSMVPNLAPAAMGFGLWGMLVGEVGLALSVVTGMTLGIVVDDTVHFLSKYLRARREHHYDAADGVRYAFTRVGTALWVTSVVLVAGFLVLTLSDFRLNADMGLLTAIVIAFALAADFLFLPPLLMKLEEKHEKAAGTDAAADAAGH